MAESIACALLWHEFVVHFDSERLCAEVGSRLPGRSAGGLADGSLLRVELTVGEDTTGMLELFDGTDRFARVRSRSVAASLLRRRMTLRARELAWRRGWSLCRGFVVGGADDDDPSALVVGRDCGSALFDGVHGLAVGVEDPPATMVPGARGAPPGPHRVCALAAMEIRAGPAEVSPLGSLAAVQLLLMHLRRGTASPAAEVRAACSLVNLVDAVVVSAASPADAAETVRRSIRAGASEQRVSG